MTAVGLVILALGLAMDATAVAMARGFSAAAVRPRDAALVGVLFGGFQGLMPLLGWLLGNRVGALLAAWDHWIAFVLLAFIGGKMIRESRRGAEGSEAPAPRPFALGTLLVLAVATSIDAFAVGLTLPLLGAALVPSVAAIATITAVLSAAGVFAGRRFGALLGRRLEALGGLVLIALGTKVLVEHLTSSGP